MKKRVLVTGGAGFLGSHLCTKLLQEGNEVLCLDNPGFRNRITRKASSACAMGVCKKLEFNP